MQDNALNVSRRGFLAGSAALAGLAATSLAGCAPNEQGAAPESLAESSTTATDWLGSAPEIADDQISEVIDADVVVVGGGTAGLFAAGAALDAGAKTVLIEQFDRDCGHGVRDDIGVYNSKVQQEAGAEVDLQALARYLQVASGYYHNGQLFKVWAEESGETFDWYADLCEKAGGKPGHRLVAPPVEQTPNEIPYGILSSSTCCFIDWNQSEEEMMEMAMNGQQVLNAYLIDNGADCHFNTQMVKILRNDERVTGCIAQNQDGDYIQFNAAKGVIICTGGYLSNEEMMHELQPEVEKVIVMNTVCMPGTDGLGIKAAMWAGAQLDDNHTTSLSPGSLIPLGQTLEEAKGCNIYASLGNQPFLRVNTLGERFMNEDDQFDAMGHALLYQPDHYCTVVYDSNWYKQLEAMNVYSAFRMFPYDDGSMSLFSMTEEDQTAYLEDMVAAGQVAKADTIEELAAQLNVPAENLVATIDRWNELCAKGVDEDFGKPAFRMVNTVLEPPFYGEQIAMEGSHTMDGLVINKDMQVLDENNYPIPGLYAAGDCSGCFLGTTYLGTVAGIASGRSVTFGRHAGRHAALNG